jgi:hypothetical protein
MGTVRPLAVHYFDCRTSRFFVDCADVPELVHSLNDLTGNFIERLSSEVHDMTDGAYRVYSERVAPLRPEFPWGRRSPRTPPDILFTAQPHRFTFAPQLAIAIVARRYPAERMLELVRAWSSFVSSDSTGIGFISNLVVIQRLLAVGWAYVLLGKAEAGDADLLDLKWALLNVIRQDIEFLTPRLGDSYPNNHLLVDRFAAWYIAACHPEFFRHSTPISELENAWLDELNNQTYEDGGYFEPSVHYHILITEAAVAYYILSIRQGRSVPDWFTARLERMLGLHADLADADGAEPQFGSCIEDPLFALMSGAPGGASLRSLHRALFRKTDRDGEEFLDGMEWAYWMTAGRARLSGKGKQESGIRAYPDMGLFVIRDSKTSTKITFRTGPRCSLRVVPGHMHSDLLGVYVVNRSVPLIVDAGTYTYRYGETTLGGRRINWRTYFTGPACHNALELASCDLFDPLTGDFRERGSRTPGIDHLAYGSSGELAFVEGTIDGGGAYSGFTRGVLAVYGEYVFIWNILPKELAVSRSAFLFQLAPDSIVTEAKSAITIRKELAAIALSHSGGLKRKETLSGSFDPLAGWVSPAYAQIVAAPQLRFAPSPEHTMTAFFLGPVEQDPPSDITCEVTDGGARAISVCAEGFRDRILVDPTGKAPYFSPDMLFEGKALWLRESSSGGLEVRAQACTRLKVKGHSLDFSFSSEQDLHWTNEAGGAAQ